MLDTVQTQLGVEEKIPEVKFRSTFPVNEQVDELIQEPL